MDLCAGRLIHWRHPSDFPLPMHLFHVYFEISHDALNIIAWFDVMCTKYLLMQTLTTIPLYISINRNEIDRKKCATNSAQWKSHLLNAESSDMNIASVCFNAFCNSLSLWRRRYTRTIPNAAMAHTVNSRVCLWVFGDQCHAICIFSKSKPFSTKTYRVYIYCSTGF